jgi:hypothetical protein
MAVEPVAELVLGIVDPPAAIIMHLVAGAVILVEQKHAAAGMQAGSGPQKLADVQTLTAGLATTAQINQVVSHLNGVIVDTLTADQILKLAALIAALTAITAEDVAALKQAELLGPDEATNVSSLQAFAQQLDADTITQLNAARTTQGLAAL